MSKLRDIETLLQARDPDHDVLKALYAYESARVSIYKDGSLNID